MVNRDYRGQRYSPLTQINTTNAAALEPVCVQQLGVLGTFSSTPVAYDGVLYVTSQNSTWALNGAACRNCCATVVDKLIKWPDSMDLVVVIHLNRNVPFSPAALVISSGLEIAALWVFGALNAQQTRRAIWRNFLETPRRGDV